MLKVIVVIIWLIAGIITFLKNDEKVFKYNFALAWFTLILNLIANCFGF